MNDRFTLAQLRCFIAVAETLSFRQAAEELRMTQPPLTRQIQALERALEARLFDRTNKRVTLTPAGYVLLEEASRILRELAHMKLKVRDAATTGSRSLTVAYLEWVEHDILPIALSIFREKHPDVLVHFMVRGSFDAEDALLSGDADVALLRPPLRSADIDITLIRSEPLVAVLPEDHALAGRSLDLIQLKDEPFIGFSHSIDGAIRTSVLEACVSAGFVPRFATKTTSIPMLLSMIASGQGITLMSEVWSKTKRAGLAYSPLHDPGARTILAAGYMRGRDNTLAQDFADAAIRAGRILDGSATAEELASFSAPETTKPES